MTADPTPDGQQLLDLHFEHDPGDRAVALTRLIGQLADRFTVNETGTYRAGSEPVVAVDHHVEDGVMVVEMTLQLRLDDFRASGEPAPVDATPRGLTEIDIFSWGPVLYPLPGCEILSVRPSVTTPGERTDA